MLEHTVETFNAACRDATSRSMPAKLDGKCTVGITPKKSNWAMPIDTPPFRAYPITGGITFTFGGLEINTKAQVLNTSQRADQGLFASGDIVGLFFHNYPSCTGQTRNAVFSRLAGRDAGAMRQLEIDREDRSHGQARAAQKSRRAHREARRLGLPAARRGHSRASADAGQAADPRHHRLRLRGLGGGVGARRRSQTLAQRAARRNARCIGSAEQDQRRPTRCWSMASLIRMLDLNDYVITKERGEIGGHPSDNIPVALAAGELSGAAGRNVIAAIVLGYEIYGRFKELMDRRRRLGRRDGLGLRRPRHGRPADGARCRAARACDGADRARARSRRWRCASATFPAPRTIANALVAQNGVQATILAQARHDRPAGSVREPAACKSVFPGINWMESITAPLPADSYIMGCHVKAYPCLATGQGIVAAGLALHRQIGGDADRIKRDHAS